MFSPQMVDFMQQKGYHFEATYLRAIGNWRRACDQRGLSELQRCQIQLQKSMLGILEKNRSQFTILLPYFYHTSAQHHFSEGILPDFDQPRTSKRKSRFSRVPQREQPAAFVPGRATLPVRGSLSIRPQFHNKPLDLPPPPTAPLHVWEHSYAQHS